MSGIISISKDVFWGKAGWCYRAARDGICEELRSTPEGCALADELSTDSHPAQWCQYLAIDDWPPEKQQRFIDAVCRFAARAAKEGPVGWNDPSFFPGFLRAMEELVHAVRSLERNGS
jgi:hypothetical protein